MTRRFATVDVFTDRIFGGNPLAVVLDAEGLGDSEMQAIAAEFNYSETTFVLPPGDPANTARVRIFTPRAEVPFAGHPNVGTAFVLAQQSTVFGRRVGDALAFEEPAGLVRIRLLREGGAIRGAELAAPQSLHVGPAFDAADVAACVGLDSGDVVSEPFPPQLAGVGIDFVFAEVAGRDALSRARPDPSTFASRMPGTRATGIYLFTGDAGDELDLHARMFAPEFGVFEDPATGSAAAALAGLLAARGYEGSGTRSWRIGQGYDLGRPSQIEASATRRDGAVAETRVGGRCVPVLSGSLL